MSLKAYDGMMTKKGLSYLYEKIKENMPLFEAASRKHLAKAFADVFVEYTDQKISPASLSRYFNINITTEDKRLLSEIDQKGVTILSYVYQVAKILTKSYFVNDFTCHLNLVIEPKGKKILVYPGIFVPAHREILLTFLEDWYAQNQTDPPEDVPSKEWKQREKDWWDFGSVRGLEMKIHVFDPDHYWNNLMEHFRGDDLINAILGEIPSDDARRLKLWKNDFIAVKMQESSLDKFYKALDYYQSEEGQKEFEKYKINNPIDLVKIDYDFISNELLPKS